MAAPLPLDQAQRRLLELAALLPIERVPPDEALGRYLAQPLMARRTQPPADLSAMDGYALRAADLPGPWQVIGESACGHPFAGQVEPGQAVRIATGALLPDGADMVLMQEDAAHEGSALKLTGTPPAPLNRHIRRRGMDFVEGAGLLAEGTRIGPAQVALTLSAGQRLVAVRRMPRLAVIDSGDELSGDPENCAIHQIPASNGAMLAAQARCAVPCTVTRIGPVEDRIAALVAALDQCADADLIVTSGGASVGDHDLVRPALEAWGAEIDFWKVAIKPGKPLLVARKGSQIVLGLPGNPVSSHVTAFLFLLPLLRAMLGAAAPLPRAFTAALAEALPQGGERQEFLRAHWDGTGLTTAVNQDSGALAALGASNALIERPASAPPAPANTMVRAYLLENGGIA